jgi:stage III sporulation protein AE
VNNLSETFQINKLAGLLKQISLWMMGFILTIFIGIITIRGTAAKTIDQVTAKTLKFAVDNFIPVVGKCFSDAVATIAGYSAILKDAISTAGLVAFAMICIFPLLKIISMIFIYKIAGALLEPISDKRIVNCLNDIGNSMTMIFACVVSVAIMFFIMVTIIASAGKQVALMQ